MNTSTSSLARDNGSSHQSSKYLIIMCGMPGTGKTTIARHLSEHLPNCNIINRDSVRSYNERFGFISPDNKAGRVVEADARLYSLAETVLEDCDTLIFDGTFHSFQKRKRAYWFSKEYNLAPVLIHCTCSLPKALNRLQEQIAKKEKVLKYSPEEVLEFYKQRFDRFTFKADIQSAHVIQVNTELDHDPALTYYPLSPRPAFIELLMQILKKPANPRQGLDHVVTFFKKAIKSQVD